MDEYLTIDESAEGFFKDRGSKFFSYAFHVETEEEITEILKDLKKKYYDARHHCYAWRLGADKKRYRANDDGEPSNSAGPPILGQIKSFDLTDILIVNVRYFGGTLLGVSGLINANKTAAAEAIKNSKITKKTVNQNLELYFEYPILNDVMRIIKDENANITEQLFEMSCKIVLNIRLNDFERIKNRFEKLIHITIK